MTPTIKIKGIKDSIITGIPEGIPWKAATKMLIEKLDNDFFTNSNIMLDIGSRDINKKDLFMLFETLDRIQVNLRGFITINEDSETLLKKYGFYVCKNVESLSPNSRMVGEERWKKIEGTIRSGQKIEFNGSIIVIGDINPDGEVSATENIVVLGALRGIAKAGLKKENSFIVALRFSPQYIMIGKYWSDFSKENSNLQTEKAVMVNIEEESMVLHYI